MSLTVRPTKLEPCGRHTVRGHRRRASGGRRSEVLAGFGRVAVTLASERPAWMYVDAGFASDVYDTLARLGADPERAVYLRPGAAKRPS